MVDLNDGIDAMLPPAPTPPGINYAPTPNALAPSIGTRKNCPAEGVGLVHVNLVGDDGNGTVTTTAVISARVLHRLRVALASGEHAGTCAH